MLAKHPQSEPASPPPEFNSTPPIRITMRQVKKAIQTFKAGSAPGPSGLRPEHLKEALKASNIQRSNKVLNSLVTFVNNLSAGSLPTTIAPYFCGARLFAAVKKQGGYCPIAVGNTMR